MGTETIRIHFQVLYFQKGTVKLNNPLMGTETISRLFHDNLTF